MSHPQSILFNKNAYTDYSARQWLSEHNYHPIKPVHVTKTYFRYRLQDPSSKKNYITISFGKGIKAVVEKKKKK